MSELFEILLCTCNGSLSRAIDFDELSALIRNREPESKIYIKESLCDPEGLGFIVMKSRSSNPDGVIIGACMIERINNSFKLAVEEAGLSGFWLEILGLREYCGLVHRDRRLATQKAAFLIFSGIAKIKNQNPIPPQCLKIAFSRPRSMDRRAFFKLLARGFVEHQVIPLIDGSRCLGSSCRLCINSCGFGALDFQAGSLGIDSERCRGCGSCISSCPVGAMELPVYTEEQLMAQLEVVSSIELTPKIIAFCCNRTHGFFSQMGERGMEYPPNILPIRVPCLGILRASMMLYAFNRMADGILMVKADCNKCIYRGSGHKAEQLVKIVNSILENYGIQDRVKLMQISSDLEIWINSMNQFCRSIYPLREITEQRLPYIKDPREQLLSLLNFLSRKFGSKSDMVEIPYFGAVDIDSQRCTLCGVCALSCPTSALNYHEEKATLSFNHRDCIACGMCIQRCPEKAVNLTRRVNLRYIISNASTTLVKGELMYCTSCGKPFATSSMISKLKRSLEEHGAKLILNMCEDCKRIQVLRPILDYKA